MSGSSSPTIREAIIILHYKAQSDKQKALIETCATALLGKAKGGGKDSRQLFRGEEWSDPKNNALKKTISKIHVCAHGNQDECGAYNAAALATFIKGTSTFPALEKVSIHSCKSAAPGGQNPEGQVFVSQFASALLPLVRDEGGSEILIKGYADFAQTDPQGRNWSVTVDTLSGNDNQFQKQLAQNSSDPNHERNTMAARPVYALHRPEYPGDQTYIRRESDDHYWVQGAPAGTNPPPGFVSSADFDAWAYPQNEEGQ